MGIRAVVQGVGHAVPSRILTNLELEGMVATSDEWITQRTGIRERRIAGDDESTGSLALAASKRALEASRIEAGELDLIICATVSGDYPWPATACSLEYQLGARKPAAFDLSAACAGFVYAVAVATAMIESGQTKKALVVGADTLTKQLDWTDRGTCILFGDAAGAMVLAAEQNTERGVLKTVLLSEGVGTKYLLVEVGGSKYPLGKSGSEGKKNKITMAGSEVYRFAISAMAGACCQVVEEAGFKTEDVDLFVPHQANRRIIDAAAQRLNLTPDKVFVNVDKYGNTSGGSIPLALSEAVEQGRLKPGMLVLTVGFGGGLVWGANLIRW